MSTDFANAAERHRSDADYLYADSRLANADQLFGISAECALKAVMQGLGMPLRPDGVPSEKYHRVHINKLWDEFVAFAHYRNGIKYGCCIDAESNPFDTWDIAQRYCPCSEITQQNVDSHRDGARTAMKVYGLAVLDGIVS